MFVRIKTLSTFAAAKAKFTDMIEDAVLRLFLGSGFVNRVEGISEKKFQKIWQE